MSLLKQLLMESGVKTSDEPSSAPVVENSNGDEQVISGDLVITACVDWMNATSKTKSEGLDVPHTIPLRMKVYKTFSTSSSSHMFILLSDQKSLLGMGRNDRGQLGIGTTAPQIYPVDIPLPINCKIAKVSTGRHHSIILFENRSVYVSGANNCGQLGLGEGIKASQDFTSFTFLPLDNVRDIACGWEHTLFCDYDGNLFTCGHPEYGQLGFGSNGEYIPGGKGPAIQYHYVSKPRKVTKFFSKDSSRKTTVEIATDSVKIVKVAAGKNHSLCLEDWETPGQNLNRVFSWGFGGYGRLGHNGSDDEFLPCEIALFSQQKSLPNRQIRDVYAGNTFSLVVSASRHVYFFGILPTSRGKEAMVYPRIQDELYDWPVRDAAAGGGFVMVASGKETIVWGAPSSGRFGVVGGGRNISVPSLVEPLRGLLTSNVSCGYGHCCMVVTSESDADADKIAQFPVFTREVAGRLSTIAAAEDEEAPGKGGKGKSKKRTQSSTTAAGSAKATKKKK